MLLLSGLSKNNNIYFLSAFFMYHQNSVYFALVFFQSLCMLQISNKKTNKLKSSSSKSRVGKLPEMYSLTNAKVNRETSSIVVSTIFKIQTN